MLDFPGAGSSTFWFSPAKATVETVRSTARWSELLIVRGNHPLSAWSSRPRAVTRRCGSKLKSQSRAFPIIRRRWYAPLRTIPHYDFALEHFLPNGPFAQLPMGPSTDAEPGGSANVSAIVWTERTADAQSFLNLDDHRFAREAARRLGSHLGDIRVVGRRWSYPLSAMIAHRYTDKRLALAGDAAHGIHPIAGQGLNLGFRDAIALADLVIEGVRNGDDVGGINCSGDTRYAPIGQSADVCDDRRN